MIRTFSLIFWSGFLILLSGNSLFSQIGDNDLMLFSEFLQLVKSEHPAAEQARLILARSEAQRMGARGAFDPKLYGDIDRKDFDVKNYYQIAEGGIKVRSIFGAELKAGYTHTQGIFLNPENNLPEAGQAVLGFSIPLVQGLFFDEARLGLRQAEVNERLNEAEAQLMLNKLLLEAGQKYWEWAYAYQEKIIREQALIVARNRFEASRQSFFQGDIPGMDTLEAFILVQDRSLDLDASRLKLENARQVLYTFLWNDGQLAAPSNSDLTPELLENYSQVPDLQEFRGFMTEAHPENWIAQAKMEQAEWERRFKVEQLKPTLNFEYFLLSDGLDLNPDAGMQSGFNNLITDNYKLGVHFEMPLLFRKERSGVQLSDLKIVQSQLYRDQKQVQITNKQQVYLEQIAQINSQIESYSSVVQNYGSLFQLEKEKFQIGESSVFLLNSREQKFIEARLKLNKLKADYQKSWLFFLDSTNTISSL